MLLILGLIATIVIASLVFMAYAMVLTFMLIGGIVFALCTLLYFGIEQATHGNNALLITAAIIWVVALLVLLAIYRNNRPPS